MSNNEKLLQVFKDSARRFADDAHSLLLAWEKVEREFPELIDDINERYPFDRDFNELLLRILEWNLRLQNLSAESPKGPLEWWPNR